MKNRAFEVLYAVALILIGCILCNAVQADDLDFVHLPSVEAIPLPTNDVRLEAIEHAWNTGDQAGVQEDFSRAAPREMAELGAMVGGTIKIGKQVRIPLDQFDMPDEIAALVTVNGQKHIWLLDECADDASRFCSFYHQPAMSMPVGYAEWGQLADVGTTLYGFGEGFSELNALPSGFILPLKGLILYQTRATPDIIQCIGLRTSSANMGFAAGIKNVALIAGAGGPVSWGVMAAVLLLNHNHAAHRATFECAEFALERTA